MVDASQSNPFQNNARITASYPASVAVDRNGDMTQKSLLHTWGDHMPVPQSVKQVKVPGGDLGLKGVPKQVGDVFTTDYMLDIAETGLPVGPAGALIGLPIGFINANYKYDKQRTMVMDEFREEIAEQLHIRPEQVNDAAMDYAARSNKSLHRTLDSLEEDRNQHPLLNAFGLGGAAVGMAVCGLMFGGFGFTVPLLGIPLGALIGGMVGFTVGYPIGNAVGRNVVDVDEHKNPAMHIDNVIAKQIEGEQVSTLDIFKVRVAQNPYLYESIKNQYGEPFHALSEQGQDMLMRKYAALTHLCAEDAMAANQGVDAGRLMIGRLADQLGPMDHAAQAKPVYMERTIDPEERSVIGETAERVEQWLEEDEPEKQQPQGKWTQSLQRASRMKPGEKFTDFVEGQRAQAANVEQHI